jgi:parallel beta-helix repeat protein
MRYLIAAAVLGLAGSSFAETINVPSDHATIQGAIDASSHGDVIAIAAGTYYEHSLNPNDKAITIWSASGNLDVAIDAQQGGGVFVINSGEADTTVIKDLVITGGSASSGSGIYCCYTSPTITNCTISDNTAHWGRAGEISCSYNSSPTISGCTITGNTADYGVGGGIYCGYSNPTISDCTITGNTAILRGGFANLRSSPVLTECVFTDNTATERGGVFFNEDDDCCERWFGIDPMITPSWSRFRCEEPSTPVEY